MQTCDKEAVMYSAVSSEQRQHVRYRLKNTLFATLQGEYCDSPASIDDINLDGVGFFSTGCEKAFPGKFIVLDLFAERRRLLLRSLPARVVYTRETAPVEDEADGAPLRYGIKFVHLTALEKKMLDHIIKKYAIPE